MFRNLLGLGALAILGFGGYVTMVEPNLKVMAVDEPAPSGFGVATVYQSKIFGQKEQITGKVNVIKDNGKTLVRVEGFKRVPKIPACLDLRAQLNLDLNPENALDLGPFKITEGNINFEIPENEDLMLYNKFMLYCKTYRTDYGHADIIALDKRPLFLK